MSSDMWSKMVAGAKYCLVLFLVWKHCYLYLSFTEDSPPHPPHTHTLGLVQSHVGHAPVWLGAVTRERLWDTDNAAYFGECASIPDLHGSDHDRQYRGGGECLEMTLIPFTALYQTPECFLQLNNRALSCCLLGICFMHSEWMHCLHKWTLFYWMFWCFSLMLTDHVRKTIWMK